MFLKWVFHYTTQMIVFNNNPGYIFFLLMPKIVPPRIDYVAPPTRLDIPKGAAIKLECRATGNPPPKIVWSRKVSSISIITYRFKYIADTRYSHPPIFVNMTRLRHSPVPWTLLSKSRIPYETISNIGHFKLAHDYGIIMKLAWIHMVECKITLHITEKKRHLILIYCRGDGMLCT